MASIPDVSQETTGQISPISSRLLPWGILGLVSLLWMVTDPVQAHVGGLSGSANSSSVPTWLTILTGGVIIGTSFLVTSLLTDQEAIEGINAWSIHITVPSGITTRLVRLIQLGTVLLLLGVLGSAFFGRTDSLNFAILVIWTGWWAGYAMTTYLLLDSWPVLNPWKRVAEWLPSQRRSLDPARGSSIAVVGLIGLVWIEVVSPVAEQPRLLGVIVLGYTGLTLIGAAVYGSADWFRMADPIARVFRTYGRFAPIQRSSHGLTLRLPGSDLAVDQQSPLPGTPAVIVAILWVTTYDGLVATPGWREVIQPLVTIGIPPRLLYLMVMVGGFGLFFQTYRLAARYARQSADTYVKADFMENWFAVSLIPIAAGYHIAHFLGFFLTLVPTLLTVLTNPFGQHTQLTVAVLPDWFGIIAITFVLIGHIMAVWIAHARALTLFPGILQPIRSQYPFVLAMIGYTLTSLWVVTQPFQTPPFV